MKKIQQLCGYLNFLCRCIVPGRAFTRSFYYYTSPNMKPHYHVNVNSVMKQDLAVWESFLDSPTVYARPFIDFSEVLQADTLDWYTDASGVVGFGGYHMQEWFQQEWSQEFLLQNPSIEFQELFAVTVSILLWGHLYCNKRIRLHCDNESVCNMLNKSTSGCKKCMYLIRIIVAHSLDLNLRIFGKHVTTKLNYLADALSRFQMRRFWRDVKKEGRLMSEVSLKIPESVWPIDKVWFA